MNNRAVNSDAYEQYVDATVALFMEHYSEVSLTDEIHRELNDPEDQNIVFPEALDARCRQLIKKECFRYRWKKCIKTATTGLRYAAIFAVVSLSIFSLLFMTVDAIRIPIINFYIEHFDGHWEITGKDDSDDTTDDTPVDESNPLAGLIPEDYQLLSLKGNSITEMTAIYENADGQWICFSATPGESWVAVDSEEAELSQKIRIRNCEAVLVVKDGVNLTWIDKGLSTTFTLFCDDMSEKEIVIIAESLISRIAP